MTTRRTVLKGAGALVIAAAAGGPQAVHAADAPANPLAFIKLDANSRITVIVKHLDKGQGIATGLATMVAEEMDADFADVTTEFAPANAKLYANLAFGPIQGTGGSTSIANSWTQLRMAGAAARQMLVEAAAAAWQVEPSAVTVANGVISAGDKRAKFGEFAARAMQRAVPANPRLKDPAQFRLIGKEGMVKRVDSRAKTDGSALYTLDIRRPGMVTAVVAHAPRFGGRLKSFDATKTKAVPGVIDVVAIPTGVAVIASDTWSAMQGRDALTVTWDEAAAEKRSSAQMWDDYRAKAAKGGLSAASRGSVGNGLQAAASIIEAEYTLPYLAHAAMEPLNGTIERRADGGIEAWGGFQMPTVDQATIALVCGVPSSKVTLNTVWAGGSFGRRAMFQPDYVSEMAHVLRATGFKAPVHLVWTREDDMRGGHYRPMALHKLRVGLGADGAVAAWDHRIVAQPIMLDTPGETGSGGVDHPTVEGVADTPYEFANFAVQAAYDRSPVPVLWWRSVGHSHTAFVMETMIDELAERAGKDKVAYRLALLGKSPRLAGVLRLAADKAGWGQPMASGKGRGVAVHQSFGSHVAMVADVDMAGGRLKVERIVAAVDCGIAVNPDVVRAQVEGAVGFALATVLRNAITFKDGQVEQANFDSFEPTRLSEMPKVEVHLIASAEAPSGMGEPGLPPMAPAIANAVAMATGKRARALPLTV